MKIMFSCFFVKDNLNSLQLGDSSQVRTGEFVIALGSPMTLNNTITSGIVSNPSRESREINHHLINNISYIQSDSMLTGGSSGGPLVNLDSEVIGINTCGIITTGISFAIPSKYVVEMLELIQQETLSGKKAPVIIPNHFLGLLIETLTPVNLRSIDPRDAKVPDFQPKRMHTVVITILCSLELTFIINY